MDKAKEFYNNNIKNINEKLQELEKNINIFGWSRLLIIILIGAIAYFLYSTQGVIAMFIALVMGIAVFCVVINIHSKMISAKERLIVELEFSEKGLKRKSGHFSEFEDTGKDLVSDDHAFCNDLDIFGKNSLFQMINTTRTRSGRKKLGEILSINVLPTREDIIKKQEAIKELSKKVLWRQKLYVNSTFKKNKNEELDELLSWCKEKNNGSMYKVFISGIFILITCIVLFMAIIGIVPATYLILNLLINFAVIKLLTRNKSEAIYLFHTMKYSVKAYSNILIAIEDENFESEYLKNLKKKLNDDEKFSCKAEMKKLSSLLDWVGDSAANAFFFLLNVLFFADVFILFNLNRWRKINGEKVSNWLEVMGEFEALSSISNLAYDNEDWCFAKISEKDELEAIEMAHPLIGERAVSNDYSLLYPKQITLITGSNMSGKSTFLRTIGVNLVLSYIGAPTRAKSFSCSIMNIYTCMRTKDNLEESISSFYAEILRIKLIIEACKSSKKVFFLLDEIFKGTNSKDRHTGATVLVKQLSENGAIGLLSTHDLELCDLENGMKEVQNYNFREYYEDNKIKFDYKIRKGKSTTQNAVYLMKLAGIDIR